MDQYKVIIEPSAESDLKDIYNYISEKLQSKMECTKTDFTYSAWNKGLGNYA